MMECTSGPCKSSRPMRTAIAGGLAGWLAGWLACCALASAVCTGRDEIMGRERHGRGLLPAPAFFLSHSPRDGRRRRPPQRDGSAADSDLFRSPLSRSLCRLCAPCRVCWCGKLAPRQQRLASDSSSASSAVLNSPRTYDTHLWLTTAK